MIKQWLLRKLGRDTSARGSDSANELTPVDPTRADDQLQARHDLSQIAFDSSICKGFRFSATIQMRTPLRILLRDGEVIEGSEAPPVITDEPWQGIWMPETKSYRELGLDIDEFQPSARASDIGPIPADGGEYLAFVKRVRQVVESKASIQERRTHLYDLLRTQTSLEYVQKLGGEQRCIAMFFPRFIDTISGLSKVSVDGLAASGWVTPNQLASMPDDRLLEVKGIGPAKLKAIRQACIAAQDKDNEFVDLVQR